MGVNNIGFNPGDAMGRKSPVEYKEYQFSNNQFDIFTKQKYGLDGTVIGAHYADGTVKYSGEAWDNYQNKYLKRDITEENVAKEEISKSVFPSNQNKTDEVK